MRIALVHHRMCIRHFSVAEQGAAGVHALAVDPISKK